MTLHLTITLLWLWWALGIVYVLGLGYGMLITIISDDVPWWLRPAVVFWPLVITGLVLWHFMRFMIGKE